MLFVGFLCLMTSTNMCFVGYTFRNVTNLAHIFAHNRFLEFSILVGMLGYIVMTGFAMGFTLEVEESTKTLISFKHRQCVTLILKR